MDKRRLLVLAVCLMCFVPMAFAQSSQRANALYLKDGSRVVGFVLDMDSVGDVRIQTVDGQVSAYPMSQVDRINWSYELKDPGPGAIYRYGDKFRWKFNDHELSDRDYERYFDSELYHTYVSGSNQLNLGGACWVYSITCAVISVLMIDPKADKQDSSVYIYAAGANVLACLGGVLTGIAKGRLDWVERTFNDQNATANGVTYSYSKAAGSFSLNPSVLLTSRNDVALGATLSIRF